jgi:hypothetical protein
VTILVGHLQVRKEHSIGLSGSYLEAGADDRVTGTGPPRLKKKNYVTKRKAVDAARGPPQTD